MKVLVFSDSHNKIQVMDEVLQKLHQQIHTVLHLGDGIADAQALEKKYPSLKFHYVRGNCDWDSQEENKKIITLNGKRIFMTHGHFYSVKMGYDRISYAAEEAEADACLFGHTHIPNIFYFSKTLFLNPGSISLPKSGQDPSYGVLDISDSGILTPSVVLKRGQTYKIMDI